MVDEDTVDNKVCNEVTSGSRPPLMQLPIEISTSSQQTRHYPDLISILAIDSTYLLYDVRKKPKDAIPDDIYEKHKDVSVTSRPIVHMRIISEYFPWKIDVKIASQDITGIRVRDVWKALYSQLQEPISESEWSILGMRDLLTSDKRESILRSAKRRGEKANKVYRIDWLGSRTKFCGLYRDEATEKRLLLPSAPNCTETWVANFSNYI